MIDDAVQLEVRSPSRYDRNQLGIRIVVILALAFGALLGRWLVIFALAGLPLLTATAIWSEGPVRFSREIAPQLARLLRWLIELSAYLLLVTDRFPLADGESVRVRIRTTTQPSVVSALARLLTSIPGALVLCVLSVLALFTSTLAVLIVAVRETLPRRLLAYQTAVVRYQARFMAYQASLIDDWPIPCSRVRYARDGSRENARAPRSAPPSLPGTGRRTGTDTDQRVRGLSH